uniref:Uncharacterized protein n=1 Tax=Acrobeloides nanus TaxID=290746 RepID=A0A914DIJ6_9BILA
MYLSIMKISIILSIFISFAYASIVHLERPKEKDRYGKLRITEKNYQAVKNVHVNWYTTSLKALMGQMGKQLYETLPKDEKRRLSSCLDNVEEKHDLVFAARCLIRARKRFQAQNEKKVQESQKSQEQTSNFQKKYEKNHEWVGGFKVTDVSKKEQFPKSFMKKSKNIRRHPKPELPKKKGGLIAKEHPQKAMISHKKLNQVMRLSNIRPVVV